MVLSAGNRAGGGAVLGPGARTPPAPTLRENTMRPRATLLPALAAALLAACTAGGAAAPSSVGPSPAASAPAPAVSLDGRAFVSTGLTGHSLVAGTRVTVSFRDGQLGASAGCNSMSGPYTLGADSVLAIARMATTEMGCEAPLMAQDAWLAGFLPGARVALAGSTLTLSKGGATLTMADRATTDLPLEGTLWTLDGLISGDTVASVPQGVTATLVFASGRVAVRTGCNTGGGDAVVADGRISFGSLLLTKMACTTPAGEVEGQMVAVLAGAQPFAIDGESLTIGKAGGPGLTLRGAAAPGATPDPGP